MDFIKKFKSASDNDYSNNCIFKNKAKKCKIVFVEGKDDIKFYKKFLTLSFKNNIPKFAIGKGKRNVIDENINNYNNNYLYIVDSDYDSFDRYELSDNILLTTGYSMENFYFYNNDESRSYDNISNFFREFTKKYCDNVQYKLISDELSNEFKNILKDYKCHTIDYYAFYMTMSLRGKYLKFYNNYEDIMKCIKEDINRDLYYYNEFEKYQIKKEIEENKMLIDNTGYLWIRGHDIFNLLLTFLNDNISTFTLDKVIDENVFELADSLYVPHDFINQL